MIEVSSSIFTYLKKIYDEKTAKEYVDFISSRPSQYIRINKLKTNQTHLTKSLSENYGIEFEAVAGVPGCFKVTKGEQKTGKTIQHILGDYYIQSLSLIFSVNFNLLNKLYKSFQEKNLQVLTRQLVTF